jgi:hypothetical protein
MRGARFNIGAGLAALLLAIVPASSAQDISPEIGQMMERALQDAENFRKQLATSEYDAITFVQEWDGRGRLRGTAKATAIVRPGDAHPVTFLSREIHGKVRLPEEKGSSKEDDDKSTLLDFSREHRVAERFDFVVGGVEEIAGENARRVQFSPKQDQPPVKSTADRFLKAINGTAWVTENKNRLVKFEMQLARPFQLLWIFAVLKEFSLQYELITPGEVLGHAKVKMIFSLNTPVYSMRQQHDIDLNNFRRRNPLVTANGPASQ